MTEEEVKAVLQREPFAPYRIHLSSGKKYDVTHREVARNLGYGLLVFIGLKEGTHAAKGYDRFPFGHIARIEDLKPPARSRRRKAS